ncbi:hypothetical protein OROHE_021354 [Orobanche hederae]
MANTYVRGITKETSNKIIIVKILRLWISTDQQKKPVSIEAILMDSEGSKIPAYVKRGLVSNFKKQLIEDIIGHITRIDSIVYVDKAHARKLDIKIEDESLKVVLWESYADKLLEIAPTNDKIENAKKMSGNDSVSRSITLRSEIRTLESEEWLNMDKHRTIFQIKRATEPRSYILFVKFVDIGDTWYYNSCVHCKTKTGDKNAREICPNTKCVLKMEATVPRSRLKVIARGSKSNDDITIVIFEDMVANLIGKSAAIVLVSLIEDGDEEALLMDFQPIFFQDYLIRIRVSREYNIVKGYNDYSVEHLKTDERIIGEYCSLAMNEEAIESKMLVGGCKEKYVGKGKEKADDEYNDQGSNDISDTTLTPAKRKATEIDEEVSIIGVQQSSTKVVIKKEKNL